MGMDPEKDDFRSGSCDFECGEILEYSTSLPGGSSNTRAYRASQKPLLSPPPLPKIFLADLEGEIRVEDRDHLLDYATLAAKSQKYTVCVIENISPEYSEALESSWDIDAQFFNTHRMNPPRERLWDNRRYTWRRADMEEPNETKDPSFGYLDGIYEYHGLSLAGEALNSSPNHNYRHCFQKGVYPIQSNTRISYCRVNPWLYLFLVDAPLNIMRYSLSSSPSLRFLYAMNRGGLQLPDLLANQKRRGLTYSLFEIMKNFLQHAWHLDVIFHLPCRSNSATTTLEMTDSLQPPKIMPPHPFIYLLSHSVHESNLRHLKAEISYISFNSIRNPDPSINNALHDLRQSLAELESNLTETIKYVPKEVSTYYPQHHIYYSQPRYYSRQQTPIEEHERVLAATKELSAFLMQTFQLFISSITVRESQQNSEIARRSTQVAMLAFIYVPLSFVTGVFGMNVVELNGEGVHIWVCFVALVVVVILTLTLFAVFHFGFERIRKAIVHSTA